MGPAHPRFAAGGPDLVSVPDADADADADADTDTDADTDADADAETRSPGQPPQHGQDAVDELERLFDRSRLEVAERLGDPEGGPDLVRAARGDAPEVETVLSRPPPTFVEVERDRRGGSRRSCVASEASCVASRVSAARSERTRTRETSKASNRIGAAPFGVEFTRAHGASAVTTPRDRAGGPGARRLGVGAAVAP